jgi:hypothetical protein
MPDGKQTQGRQEKSPKISGLTLISAPGGIMTVHIGAKPGEIAETVLLPGDPYRARWAAQTFLKDAVLVNEVRGCLAIPAPGTATA